MVRDPFKCGICGKDADGLYLFTRELRQQLMGDPDRRVLCWDCVETQLGRPVRITDLKQDASCNQRYIKLLQQLEKSQSKETISCEI